jgi:ATP-binding cassette subfamily F protein uup
VGGYTDWLRQRPQTRTPQPRAESPALAETAAPPTKRAARAVRLGYMEGRELAALPGQIEALEREQSEIGARLSQPDYRDGGHERIRADGERLNELSAELERCYARWEELEARRGTS